MQSSLSILLAYRTSGPDLCRKKRLGASDSEVAAETSAFADRTAERQQPLSPVNLKQTTPAFPIRLAVAVRRANG
jgi:hypothetical protein